MNARELQSLIRYTQKTPRLSALLEAINLNQTLKGTPEHAQMLLIAAHWRANEEERDQMQEDQVMVHCKYR